MKASELIELLKKNIDDFGDKEVIFSALINEFHPKKIIAKTVITDLRFMSIGGERFFLLDTYKEIK